jgi:Cys-rich protein (TIGR01571 family)
MSRTHHPKHFVASWLLVALLLPRIVDAKVRDERRQNLQQEGDLGHLSAHDAVKPRGFLLAGESALSSPNVATFSRPLDTMVSWALPLHGAFVGRLGALVQTVSGHKESDEPQMTIADTAETVPLPNVYGLLFTALIWGGCATGAAYYFRTFPDEVMLKDSEGSPEQLSRFSSDIYDVDACLNEPMICTLSICCPCVLWARTVDRLSLMRYWTAFAIFASLWILHHAFAIFICWFALAILLTYNRHRIRQAFGMQVQWGIATLTSECVCFCVGCVPCLISQEARHVKRAVALGHSAVNNSRDVPNV